MSPWIKWPLLTAAVVAGMVLLAFLAGLLIPREHAATSTITLRPPVDSVWRVVRDPTALIGTWPELTSARRVEGAAEETWDEEIDGFVMRLRVLVDEPPNNFATEVVGDDDAVFGGMWVYRLDPLPDGGTRISITEDGWVANPLFRTMMVLFGVHSSIDGYLKALGRHFGEDVTPEHVL